MIRITAKQDGFRRCGIAHPKGATEYPDATFTKNQMDQLQAEPMLVVEVVPTGKPNVADTVVLVQAAATIEALDQLAADETRKGVLDAIDKRRAELSQPQG